MRLYIFLILIAVTTAFSAGYLSLSLYSKPLSARTVDNHIVKLRQKLDPDMFETVRDVGYRKEVTIILPAFYALMTTDTSVRDMLV